MSKVTTKTDVRLSYTNLLTPRAANADKPDIKTFSTAILIPKSDTETVNAVKAAIKEALTDGTAKLWGGKAPKGLKNPLRDGDEEREDDETYKGMYFINAKGPRGGQEQPILLDPKGAETVSPDVIYSGVFAKASLQFYPFDKQGNRGVACGVTAVLSSGHGDPLGTVVTAESARSEFGVSTPASAAAAEFSGTTAPAAEAEEDDSDPWGD